MQILFLYPSGQGALTMWQESCALVDIKIIEAIADKIISSVSAMAELLLTTETQRMPIAGGENGLLPI